MAKVNFRTNVLLKSIIGKDLITDDNLAVLELVKNSFDAGSDIVDLTFLNLGNQGSSKLIISDFGSGMSEYDLVNKWLNIAYSEKKEKREEYGRILAGNKGVGRFSCDKLGKYLTIYTKKENSEYIKLFIDWNWFEQEGDIDLNIQDIEIEMTSISENEFINSTNYSAFKSGTILEISSLRETWTHSKILELKKQLERLINPNQSFKSSSFDIIINAKDFLKYEENFEDFNKVNGLVRNRIFEKLTFRVTSIQSKISKDGKNLITILKDRGITIFTLVEKNPFDLLKNIKIFIYYLNPYSKAYFTKQTGIRSVDFGSIFLFINGFRIPPYGDYGDDWLGMENRKSQGYARYLGTREVVGRIEVEDSTENFKIISNRSGVVSNETFNQLTKSDSPFGYYYKTFRRLERFVAEGIKWDSTPEKENQLEQKILNDPNWNISNETYLEDTFTRNTRIISVIENILNSKKDDVIRLRINKSFVEDLIEEKTVQIESDIEEIVEKLKNKDLSPDELTGFLNKIDKSRNELKSFSDIVAAYNENPKRITNTEKLILDNFILVEKQKSTALKKLKKAKKAQQSAEKKIEKITTQNLFLTSVKSQDLDEIVSFMHSIGISSDIINNYISGLYKRVNRGENIANEVWADKLRQMSLENRKVLAISQFATKANFKLFAEEVEKDVIEFIHEYLLNIVKPLRSEDINIKSSNENVDKFVSKFKPIELTIIIDNLVSNSIRAKHKNKKIVAEFLTTYKIENDNTLIVSFKDNGIGISDDIINNIFDFGFTTTTGSGLGLFHIKNIISDSDFLSIIVNNKIKEGVEFKLIFKK
jgi:signal transduction histidine kinase